MPEFDMNALLRGRGEQEAQRRTSLDTYRHLSPVAREHEWQNLTAEDKQTALAEGLQPSFVAAIAGKADGSAGGERDVQVPTDMNDLLREARHRGVYS